MLWALPQEVLERVVLHVLQIEAHGLICTFSKGQSLNILTFCSHLRAIFAAAAWQDAVNQALIQLRLHVPSSLSVDIPSPFRKFSQNLWALTPISDGILSLGADRCLGKTVMSVIVNRIPQNKVECYSIPSAHFQTTAIDRWVKGCFPTLTTDATGNKIGIMMRGSFWMLTRNGASYTATQIFVFGTQFLPFGKGAMTPTHTAIINMMTLHIVHNNTGEHKLISLRGVATNVAANTIDGVTTVAVSVVSRNPNKRFFVFTLKNGSISEHELELLSYEAIHGSLEQLILDGQTLLAVHSRCVMRTAYNREPEVTKTYFRQYTDEWKATKYEKCSISVESYALAGNFAFAIVESSERECTWRGLFPHDRDKIAVCMNRNGRVLYSFHVPYQTYKLAVLPEGLLCVSSSGMYGAFTRMNDVLLKWQ